MAGWLKKKFDARAHKRLQKFIAALDDRDVKEVRKILKKHPELSSTTVNTTTRDTPLHRVARFNNAEIITLLYDAGARTDVRNRNDITPIHIALKSKRFKNARLIAELESRSGGHSRHDPEFLRELDRKLKFSAVLFPRSVEILAEIHGLTCHRRPEIQRDIPLFAKKMPGGVG